MNFPLKITRKIKNKLVHSLLKLMLFKNSKFFKLNKKNLKNLDSSAVSFIEKLFFLTYI